MKRLLVLANSDSSIFKFRSELLNVLSIKFEICIGIPFGEYIDDIKSDKYKFINIPINRHGTNPIEDYKLIKKYKSIIKEFKPAVVLLYTIKPNIYGAMACASTKVPCICNITGLGTALETPGNLQRFLIAMYRYSMKKVSTIFFQNQHSKDCFINYRIGHQEQYYLLPGSGVNLNRFHAIDFPMGNVVRYLFVARIIKEKGIEEFLSVAKRFHAEGLQAEFHICGFCEQDYQAQLNSLSDKGVIVYHGMVKDMRKVYAIASCVVLPSYYPEGQSNVLLEGAASARPLITTDHPGCREAVNDGITGYLVKSKDIDDLYEKTKKIYELGIEDRRLMGLRGRRKIEKEFDRNIIIHAYQEKINEALNIGYGRFKYE